MNNHILLCTVGGAHQPILKAIGATSPQYVCFFCTDNDPVTNKPGSSLHVTGEGAVIMAGWNDNKPTLPNIPAQAGLNHDQFETQIVPADDLDGAYFAMSNAIAGLGKKFPGVRFIADYTGGTKTMTAALVCAALERDDVELQLVAGARPNLVRVEDGTEQAMGASVDHLRLDREMKTHLRAWHRFAYQEAADGLARIRITANDPRRTQLELARDLSRALADWDNFNHELAYQRLHIYGGQVARYYPPMLPTLSLLKQAGDTRSTQNDPVRLFDLYLNVERRAAQGRFDDAIARWYRLMEWTAQWELRKELKADTSDFPRELLPQDADVVPNRDGKIRLGLWQAWQVVEHRLPEPCQNFVKDHGAELRDLINMRNDSILAHGFRSVTRSDWQRVYSWTQKNFLPFLRDLADQAGLKRAREPQQLPTTPPEFLKVAPST